VHQEPVDREAGVAQPDFEPHPLQQGRQTVGVEVVEVLRRGDPEVAVDDAGRPGGELQRAEVVGHGDRQHAARRQQARQSGQQALRVGYMLQHVLHGADVHRLARLDQAVEQLEGVAELRPAQELGMKAGERRLGKVHTPHGVAAPFRGRQQPALTAADVQEPPAAFPTAGLGDRRQHQPGQEVAVLELELGIGGRIGAVGLLVVLRRIEGLQRLRARRGRHAPPAVGLHGQRVACVPVALEAHEKTLRSAG
jgi:hypothetical protein